LSRILTAERVGHVMRREPFSVPRGTQLRGVLEGIQENATSCALVLEGESLAGIFTERDYLEKIAGRDVSLDEPVDSFMTPQPRVLTPDDSVAEALRIIVEGGYRHLPIVADGQVEGLLSALDLVKYIAELYPTQVYNLPPHLDQVYRQAEGA
jgi:CBS domain-containing protein